MSNFSKYYDFLPGQRYSYLDKYTCYQCSIEAINEGHQVQYGRSNTGLYYFEIIDPFIKTNKENKN